MTRTAEKPSAPYVSNKFTSTVVAIDPEIARRWLGNNTHNRNLNAETVNRYARDMRQGAWHLNGEALKFDTTGTLLDGQHRLHAIIKANVIVTMLVVRGLQPAAQDSMDTGRKRTAADVLSLRGRKNSTLLASTIRNAITVEQVGYSQLGRYAVTSHEVEKFLAIHPDVEFAVDLARKVSRELDCAPAVVGYAAWALMQIDAADAVAFFTDAAERVGLRSGDPVLALGRRFAEARRNREHLSHPIALSMIFRAWNARRTGKSMSVLRVNNGKGGFVDVPEPR